jgi:cytochrome c-type biogenesis protein
MTQDINIFIAFAAGLLSFVSPCVFPLVPSYLAQLVGPGIVESMMGIKQGSMITGETVSLTLVTRRTTLWYAVAFVGGFSLTFIALGATASTLGGFLRGHQDILSRAGGIMLIAMGLHYANIIRIPFLSYERRLSWRPAQRGYLSSFIIGIVFSFGWTPCIGITLAPILQLAAQSATLHSGIILLVAYSAGLGIPFIAMGAAFSQFYPLLRRLAPYLGTIEKITGIIIIIMGIFIFNNWLIVLNRFFVFLPSGV